MAGRSGHASRTASTRSQHLHWAQPAGTASSANRRPVSTSLLEFLPSTRDGTVVSARTARMPIGSVLMRHEDWQIGVSQDPAGEATKDHLTNAAMTVAAHHQQIRVRCISGSQ